MQMRWSPSRSSRQGGMPASEILIRESGRKGTREGWSLIDGTGGKGQGSSGGEGEGADLISTPTPTQACRSPDQPCEVRKGCGKMGPGSLGGKELDPSGWVRRSYLRAEVQNLQTIGDFMA